MHWETSNMIEELKTTLFANMFSLSLHPQVLISSDGTTCKNNPGANGSKREYQCHNMTKNWSMLIR
jgi:proteasome assembly chaperone (PAC2) family protein